MAVPVLPHEQGLDVVFKSQRGFAAPPGSPENIRARFESLLRETSADPAIRQYASLQGMPLRFLSAAEWLLDFHRQGGIYRQMWQAHPRKE